MGQANSGDDSSLGMRPMSAGSHANQDTLLSHRRNSNLAAKFDNGPEMQHVNRLLGSKSASGERYMNDELEIGSSGVEGLGSMLLGTGRVIGGLGQYVFTGVVGGAAEILHFWFYEQIDGRGRPYKSLREKQLEMELGGRRNPHESLIANDSFWGEFTPSVDMIRAGMGDIWRGLKTISGMDSTKSDDCWSPFDNSTDLSLGSDRDVSNNYRDSNLSTDS